MEKRKLGICMEDQEYQSRFVKCLMNHYKEVYEVHIIHHLPEISENQKEKFDVLITGDEKISFVLEEGEIYHSKKYQEVYKIMDDLEKVLVQKETFINLEKESTKLQLIGVFSLVKERLQLPFSALLGEVLGEENHVLILDIQGYSGLAMEIEIEDILGMEDMISIAATETYTTSRIAASIGHEQKWDYVYPAKNISCLTETNNQLYQKMIHILQNEQGYNRIIINFGTIFPGIIELMDSCDQFYFLTEKEEERSWRENEFLSEVNRLGKENFLQSIIWMGMPIEGTKEKSWRQLVKRWMWSELGDVIRERNWRESQNE